MTRKMMEQSPLVQPLPKRLGQPKILFTDVDDTLTWEGQLPVQTYAALYQLREAGIEVVPLTGGCAGWCDCLIKTWPVSTIIGENGSLFMQSDDAGIVHTHYLKDESSIDADLIRLKEIAQVVQQKYPLIGYTQDQPFRLTDIAFDIGQTVSVPDDIARQATDWLIAQGLQARMSSIHINVWLGDHSKATAAKALLEQRNIAMDDCIFVGDSPNDESMFEQFSVSVGVANIERFLDQLSFRPAYITSSPGGFGFVELAEALVV